MREFNDITSDISKAMDSGKMSEALVFVSELRGHSHSMAQAFAAQTEGWIQLCTGQFGTALALFREAYDAFERVQDIAGTCGALMRIGIVYQRTGSYPQALEYLYRSLDVEQQIGDPGRRGTILSNIAIVHSAMAEYEKAMQCYIESLALHGSDQDLDLANLHTNIGNVYSNTHDFAKAYEHYEKAEEIASLMGNRSLIGQIRVLIMNMYLEADDVEAARAVLPSIGNEAISNPFLHVAMRLAIGKIYLIDGEYASAHSSFLSALELAKAHEIPAACEAAYLQLRDLALKRNDLPGYVEYSAAHQAIREETNGRRAAQQVAMQDAERRMAAERQEHARQRAVLHATLPPHIADRVARGEVVQDRIDSAAVLFLDIVGFTSRTARLEPTETVALLQQIFTEFDTLCATFGVTKIKTIGDSYMAVAFPCDGHVAALGKLAHHMAGSAFAWPGTTDSVEFRIGLHYGTVIAGVLGTERLQYDVWGDTVNVASRMESTGEPGRIHVSEAFAIAARPHASSDTFPFEFVERGEIEIKGKGPMKTYWLNHS